MARPTWTRKTYEMVADILREAWTPDADGSINAAANNFAAEFAADHPNFDRQRFMDAIFGESK